MLSNSTMLMWLEPPSPMVPYCRSPGLALACASISARVLSGDDDGTTSSWFEAPKPLTGVKSFTS